MALLAVVVVLLLTVPASSGSAVLQGAAPAGAPPPAPTSVSVTPGMADALIHWVEPPNASVTGYLVKWSVEGNAVGNLTTNGSTFSTLITGLFAYVPYTVTVAALNANGTGPAGPTVTFTLFPWTIYRGLLTPPFSTVTIDGTPVAVAGGTYLVNTSYRDHVLVASARNYSSQPAALSAVWNGTIWQNFTLDLLPSVVRGTVYPASSSVSWDGSPVVVTSGAYQFSAPADSNHTLNASFPGYRSASLRIFVPANGTVWTNVTLVAQPGALNLSVDPPTASVTVNGTAVALAANGNASVPLGPGTYEIAATASGFVNYSATATILAGQTTSLEIRMNRTSAPGGSTGGKSPPWAILLSPGALLALGIVVVAAAAIVLGVRRRRPPDSGKRRRDEGEVDRRRQLREREPDEMDEADPTGG